MAHFQTKHPTLSKFWRILRWKMLTFYVGIWNIFLSFGIFYGNWVHFVVIWNIITRFGMLYREKSGNPDRLQTRRNVIGMRRAVMP
jgi:hypothetical protein